MRLLIGLGNPGQKYVGTRHNVGFAALDYLSGKYGLTIQQNRFSSLLARGRLGTVDCLLAKPQTFMNLSGLAVQQIVNFFRIELGDLLVLHDDMDIEPGRSKVTARGGPGGHKGVASIIEHLGSSDFARIKIGIGRPESGLSAESYVLGRFSAEENDLIEKMLASAAEAAEVFLTGGVAKAQALYNRKYLNE